MCRVITAKHGSSGKASGLEVRREALGRAEAEVHGMGSREEEREREVRLDMEQKRLCFKNLSIYDLPA